VWWTPADPASRKKRVCYFVVDNQEVYFPVTRWVMLSLWWVMIIFTWQSNYNSRCCYYVGLWRLMLFRSLFVWGWRQLSIKLLSTSNHQLLNRPTQWATSLFDLTSLSQFAERKFDLSTYLSQKVKWFRWAKALRAKVWSKYILRPKNSGLSRYLDRSERTWLKSSRLDLSQVK